MEKEPIRKIKDHIFYGRKYKFFYARPESILPAKEIAEVRTRYNLTEDDIIQGLTDDNRTRNKKLIVSDEIEDPKELLRVLLDEAMHALDSTIDNDVVAEKAQDLCDFLWKCGYRRVTKSS